MKAKKVLFKTSGIVKIVVSSMAIVLFLLVMLISRTLIETMFSDIEGFTEMINEMVESDPSLSYLQDYDLAQLQNYLVSAVNSLSLFVIFLGIAGIVFGIFNLIFAKKYDIMLANKTGKKVTFMIFSLLFYPGLVTNILTIIALFLKDKKKEEISDNVIVEGENV